MRYLIMILALTVALAGCVNEGGAVLDAVDDTSEADAPDFGESCAEPGDLNLSAVPGGYWFPDGPEGEPQLRGFRIDHTGSECSIVLTFSTIISLSEDLYAVVGVTGEDGALDDAQPLPFTLPPGSVHQVVVSALPDDDAKPALIHIHTNGLGVKELEVKAGGVSD